MTEDIEIIEGFSRRDESALSQAQSKYGQYLLSIASRILHELPDSRELSEECFNDALYSAWNLIPPHKPEKLSAFLGKLVRNHAINRLRSERAQKRGGGEYSVMLEELSETASSSSSDAEERLNLSELTREINSFLKDIPKRERVIFVQRYWYCLTVDEIAEEQKITVNHTQVILSRTRKKLREHLKKGGFSV